MITRPQRAGSGEKGDRKIEKRRSATGNGRRGGDAGSGPGKVERAKLYPTQHQPYRNHENNRDISVEGIVIPAIGSVDIQDSHLV
jgi:hypothetical protein